MKRSANNYLSPETSKQPEYDNLKIILVEEIFNQLSGKIHGAYSEFHFCNISKGISFSFPIMLFNLGWFCGN